MKRLTCLALWVVVIIVASFMLYRVKYEVQSIKIQIANVSSEMAQEREMLNVEAAEWAYINRPENLRKLASKYLDGKNVTVEQVAEVEAFAFHEQHLASAEMNFIDINKNNGSVAVSYRSGSAHR
ncbi:MAG: hypothetical protein ABL857_03745 [Rickettsiales bacterium]|jgi:hypothetical protein